MSLAYLKSGTDIRGTALGENCDLNDAVVQKIALGFLHVLHEKTGLQPNEMSLYIGRDSRLSGERILNALCSVFIKYGVNVTDCGLCSTPAMFMTTVKKGCTAAVQITASHHPSDKNGLKFFTRAGGFEGSDIAAVLSAAEQKPAFAECEGRVQTLDFMTEYAADLREKIKQGVGAKDYEHPLAGFHIVVDAGNGVGGFYANDVLSPLGADVSGSEFLEPDGHFPNHVPNPENPDAMGFISRSVLRNKADFGIIFDTDVDRAACVDADGREINRNRLVALASAIALENEPGATVVTDSVTSDGLKAFVQQHLGGVHHRFRRGYKNVINEALRLNAQGVNCPLAIETSGHAALRENYFLDDGAYLITKILILLAKKRKEGKPLSSVIEALQEPVEEKELRFKILQEDFRPCGEDVIAKLETWASGLPFATPADDNREGFRVSFDEDHGAGWLLLRLSVHDPILPLNIESDKQGGCRQIATLLFDFLKDFKDIDISALKDYISSL
ncbi:MAG: phosphomannomutase/phosphoglucomutase [Clostridia bacterium]|nr:phosphomannomutase/phosphoglucomutase [Clostridia bacterium]